MVHSAPRSTMEATGPALPKSKYITERERERDIMFFFCVRECRLAGYDVVITTYNIVGIEGESCEPELVINEHYYYTLILW